MLSEDTSRRLNNLKWSELYYRPDNEEVRPVLGDKTLNILIAASAIGKSATKSLLTEIDPEFGGAGSRTSRPRRPDDNLTEYDFDEHTDTGLAEPISIIESGKAVQYTIHPTLGYLYLSEPRHYSHKHSLLDMMSQSVEQIRHVPFQSVRTLQLVSEPDAWLSRFHQRFSKGDEQYRPRLIESIASHRWTIRQPDTDNWIIETRDGQPEETARYIHELLTEGRPHDNAPGRALAQAQIKAAHTLLALS